MNSQEATARNAGKEPGKHVKSADPANCEKYKALQQAWKNKETTLDMTTLLDPATEHRIELGACCGQVSSTESRMHRLDTLESTL